VDVANVMGSRPDGWWRDRAGAAVRLYSELAALAASGRVILPAETGQGVAGPPPDAAGPVIPPVFVMVLEGAARAATSRISAAPGQAPPGRIRVVEARGSGDDAIVDLVRDLSGRCVVVTADRALRDRCVAAGATVLGPAWLLARLRP